MTPRSYRIQLNQVNNCGVQNDDLCGPKACPLFGPCTCMWPLENGVMLIVTDITASILFLQLQPGQTRLLYTHLYRNTHILSPFPLSFFLSHTRTNSVSLQSHVDRPHKEGFFSHWTIWCKDQVLRNTQEKENEKKGTKGG